LGNVFLKIRIIPFSNLNDMHRIFVC
jgi:hypothetical protein